MTRTGDVKCHGKTMMDRETCDPQKWTPIMCRLDKGYTQKDIHSGTARMRDKTTKKKEYQVLTMNTKHTLTNKSEIP